MVFREGAKEKWAKSSMKYIADFGISYWRGSLSIARVSGINATKGALITVFPAWSPRGPVRGRVNSAKKFLEVGKTSSILRLLCVPAKSH